MIAAEVIVLENRARWAPELQRQFYENPVAVRACRDIASLRERVTAAYVARKDCVAVLDPVGWPGECLPIIAWLRGLKIHVVVAANSEIELLEPSLRELGVTTFLLPPISGHEIGSACRRLISQNSIQSLSMGMR